MSSKSTMILGYWDIRGVSAVSIAKPLGLVDGRGGGRALTVSGLREKGFYSGAKLPTPRRLTQRGRPQPSSRAAEADPCPASGHAGLGERG